jgi:hypothetical protein
MRDNLKWATEYCWKSGSASLKEHSYLSAKVRAIAETNCNLL